MSATYPLDMVRGRLTVQSIQGSHRYRGIVHATSVIIKEASPCFVWTGQQLRLNPAYDLASAK